jgi:hypothetical protein
MGGHDVSAEARRRIRVGATGFDTGEEVLSGCGGADRSGSRTQTAPAG